MSAPTDSRKVAALLAKLRDEMNLHPLTPMDVVLRHAQDMIPKTIGEPSVVCVAQKTKSARLPNTIWLINDQQIDHGHERGWQSEQFGNALRKLGDFGFLPKSAEFCEARAGSEGRVWVSMDIYRLYPDPELCRVQSREIPGYTGWYFGTNYGKDYKLKMIKSLCENCGVSFKEV